MRRLVVPVAREPSDVVAGSDVVTPLEDGSYDGRVRFDVLGRLRVIDGRDGGGEGGVGLRLGGARERLVLAMLLANANSVVSTDALVEGPMSSKRPRWVRRCAPGHVRARTVGSPHRRRQRP